MRLAKIKTPPKSTKTSIFLKSAWNAGFMILVTVNLVVATYILRTITSMFNEDVPKFVEVTRIQYVLPYYKPQIPSSSSFGKSQVNAWSRWRHFLPKESEGCISPMKGGSALIFIDWVQESICNPLQEGDAIPSQCLRRDTFFFSQILGGVFIRLGKNFRG